jgi:hypothetical protein
MAPTPANAPAKTPREYAERPLALESPGPRLSA